MLRFVLLLAAALAIGRAVSPRWLRAGETPPDTPEAARRAFDAGDYDESVRAYNAWAFRQGTLLPLTDELAPSIRWLESRGVNTETARSRLLEPRDAAYLAERMRLRRIALAATGDATTEEARAEALFAFVVREVAPYVPDALHERPEDVLVRGYGSCDQAAWALVALAEQAGLPGVILYLRTAPGAESHHTVAALRVGGMWRIYDPFSAIRVTKPDLATALRHPERLNAVLPTPSEGCLFVAEDLAAATLNVPLHPRGQLPRWAAFRNALETRDWGLVLWTDPVRRIWLLHRELGLSAAASAKSIPASESAEILQNTPVQPFSLAYDIYARESEPVWLYRQDTSPSRGPYREGRLLHLAGKPLEALGRMAESVAGDSTTAGDAALALRYRALARQAAGDYAEAAAIYARIRAEHPGSPWARLVSWNEAHCRLRLGETASAVNQLRTITGPRRAAAQGLLVTLDAR